MPRLLNHAAVRQFIRDMSALQEPLEPLTRIGDDEIERLEEDFQWRVIGMIGRHPKGVKTFRARDRWVRAGHE